MITNVTIIGNMKIITTETITGTGNSFRI